MPARFGRQVLVGSVLVALSTLAAWKTGPEWEGRARLDGARSPASASPAKIPEVSRGSPRAAKRTEPAPTDPVKLLNSLGGKGSWRAMRGNGASAASWLGGTVPEIGNDPKAAFRLARQLARAVGAELGPESFAARSVVSSGRSIAMYFPQIVDGFPVYEGYLTLVARGSDGAVFLVNNGMKPVTTAPSNSPGILASEAARDLAETLDASEPRIELQSTRPVVWSDSGQAELAWSFDVETQRPTYEHRNFVLSARTGRILHVHSTLIR